MFPLSAIKQTYRDKIPEVERQGIQQGEIQGKLKTVTLLRQLAMTVEEIAPPFRVTP